MYKRQIQLNFLTVLAVVLSILITVGLYFLLSDSVSLPQMLGVHFGAVTNTPGLGATQEALDMFGYVGENIAVGYACAYPLGVVGICSRALHEGVISSPGPDTIIHCADKLRIVSNADDKDAILTFFGREDTEVDLATEHSPLITRTILVSREEVNGIRLAELHLSKMDGVNITRIFRAGMTLFPYQNLHLQMGDQVYCVGPERAIARLAAVLGNQVKKLDHPNIISIFLGIAVGIILGYLPLAIPGMPVPLKLGLAGGPLIVAILLGYWGPHIRLVTYTTHSANLMLREMGIALFLASVGLSAGGKFVSALLEGNGLLYIGSGLVITIVPLLIIGVIARIKFKLNYHSIVGLLAGATTDPPTLAYANTLSEKDCSAIAYSTVYPLAMFLRILTGQLVLILLWGFVV